MRHSEHERGQRPRHISGSAQPTGTRPVQECPTSGQLLRRPPRQPTSCGDWSDHLCNRVHPGELLKCEPHPYLSYGDSALVKYEGFDFPDDLYYGEDQIWVKKEGDKVRIGFTSFGMDLAGKIKFVRLRPAGKEVEAGRSIGTLESGKWTGPVKAPVAGMLTEVNDALKDNPGLLNEDPYGKGWIAVIKPSAIDDSLAKLTSGAAIEAWVKKEFAEKKK
ncbi:MAG: glycine cleavage system protein H [Candidatus Thorarchaeota archaeon]|nr:glycine cleavage system protein H [Candidatus Thorarchaeota archaeon]